MLDQKGQTIARS